MQCSTAKMSVPPMTHVQRISEIVAWRSNRFRQFAHPLLFRTLLSLILFCFVTGTIGCKRKREYIGIGQWQLGKTVRSQAGGVCAKEAGLIWCSQDPLSSRKVALGDQSGDIGLYFESNEPDAPLVEIVVKVASCDIKSLAQWMRYTFGDASQAKGQSLYWLGTHAFIAMVPIKNSNRCNVSLVTPQDKKRVRELLNNN